MLLSDPHAKTPAFVAQQPGTYEFELVVSDNTGLVSRLQTATFVVGNDPPDVQVVSLGTGMVGGEVAVQFTLADSTADLANVQLEFSVDGGETFLPATLIDRAPSALGARQSDTTPSTNSPVAGEGERHTFVWNTTQDLGTMSPVDVFIRVTLVDSESGAASGPFTYHPLLDTVAEACGLPSGEWELSPAAWETLRVALARCQDNLLTVVNGEIDLLKPVFSERSIVKTGAVLPEINLTPLVEASRALQQASADDGPEAIAERYAEVEAGIAALEERLSSVRATAQLANIDLQNMLQKKQQSIQTISNVSKMLHDTALAVIRKIG